MTLGTGAMPDLAGILAGGGAALREARDFAVDLRAGLAPLIFDPASNPSGLTPEIVEDEGRRALRLAVRAGGPAARTDERCEVREPDKVPLGAATVHRFALKVDPAFPRVPLRCVVAQMKGNDGLSPLFALRVDAGRIFADWRLPGVTVEHHDGLPDHAGRWHAYELAFGPDEAWLAVDGRLVTRARAVFGPPGKRRYLKLGPYRDRHPGWGDAPAAVLIRDVSRR